MNTIINEIKKYGYIAGHKGYTPGISGNISSRFEDKFIITASGSANGYLEDEDFCVIDSLGNTINSSKKPSSERYLHLEFYKKRKDINCIFHVHPPYLTAFASSNAQLNDMVSPEIIYCFDKIPKADYALPGSEELVKNTSKHFLTNDVVLMKNHGIIIGAKDVKHAYLKLELLEEYAKTIIFTKLLGGANIIPDEEVQKIYSLKRGN